MAYEGFFMENRMVRKLAIEGLKPVSIGTGLKTRLDRNVAIESLKGQRPGASREGPGEGLPALLVKRMLG